MAGADENNPRRIKQWISSLTVSFGTLLAADWQQISDLGLVVHIPEL